MFNLFALTNASENTRVRFSLSVEVQRNLTVFLGQQETDFNSSGQGEIAFDGKYKPDIGEVLVISNFVDVDGLADAIINPLAVPEVEPTSAMFNSIKALFSGRIENGIVTVLIQHFDKKRIISTNGLSIFHSSNVYRKIEGIGLTIDNKLTAILDNGTLKFHSFHHIRQIFDMSTYYREATDGDITEFVSLSRVHVHNVASLISMSDTWVRRKFSLISQSKILERVPVIEIKMIATDFRIALITETIDGIEKIVLPNTKAELKTILRFLDEDYYKSPLLQNRYITNSKRPIL